VDKRSTIKSRPTPSRHKAPSSSRANEALISASVPSESIRVHSRLLLGSPEHDPARIQRQSFPPFLRQLISGISQAPFLFLRISRDRYALASDVHHYEALRQVVIEPIRPIPFHDRVLVNTRLGFVLRLQPNERKECNS